MWDLIVSVPDHCLSFYFTAEAFTILQNFAFSGAMHLCQFRLSIVMILF